MGKYCFFFLVLLSCARIQAQTCGFSTAKNWPQLHHQVVFEKNSPLQTTHFRLRENDLFSNTETEGPTPKILSPVLLPKWSADNLPFFCKIEHDWGKNARLPMKFRLGSVEYVDWLEGKHP